MVDFDRAYSDVIDILQDRPKSKNPICFKMYKGTNENLSKILRMYDFKNKDVLSVLSSSDQMMSSYYLGASNVDTFDRNFTPYLFFYLKKWCMEYTGKSYLSASNRELMECLDLHRDNEFETNVAAFWRRVIVRTNGPLAESELFFKNFADFCGVPYESDVETMSDIIRDKEPSFQFTDISSETDFPKQYDIVVLSNILEYPHAYEEDEKPIYERTMDNLVRALKDDGIVICSSLIFERAIEKEIFSDCFDFHEGAYSYDLHRYRDKPISYSYTKKRR